MSSPFRLLSAPHPVHFAGFSSDTYRLQQSGWELSVEQDMMRDEIRLAMRHRDSGLYAVSNGVDHRLMQLRGMDYRLEFHIAYVSSKIMINMMATTPMHYKPIDARPQVVSSEIKSIEDFNIFATPLVRTEEIIVEPATVSGLLEQIKALQLPEQERIRKTQRLRDAREGMSMDAAPRQTFHAQILSIAA